MRVLTEGVHSGDASGIVPSSFRILRMLLSRIEDEASGTLQLAECFAEIPADRKAEARATAAILGDEVFTKMPFAGSTKPMGTAPEDLILNRTWRPQLAVIGMDGYPLPQNAGNVLLPYTVAKLSLRTPPTCDAEAAVETLRRVLEADPPYGAEVSFEAEAGQTGWNAPSLAPWLEASLKKASQAHFGKPVAFMGEGGSIPFMAMLGEKVPRHPVRGDGRPGASTPTPMDPTNSWTFRRPRRSRPALPTCWRPMPRRVREAENHPAPNTVRFSGRDAGRGISGESGDGAEYSRLV